MRTCVYVTEWSNCACDVDLDYEDNVGGIKTRPRYKQVGPAVRRVESVGQGGIMQMYLLCHYKQPALPGTSLAQRGKGKKPIPYSCGRNTARPTCRAPGHGTHASCQTHNISISVTRPRCA